MTLVSRIPASVPQVSTPPLAFAFHDAERRFRAKSVLTGINLGVEQGQFIAIIGKSGCGKSTLLHLLAGLDQPDGGSIELGPTPARQTAMRVMFQERACCRGRGSWTNWRSA